MDNKTQTSYELRGNEGARRKEECRQRGRRRKNYKKMKTKTKKLWAESCTPLLEYLGFSLGE
jgi:hypothetical protein